MSAKLGKFIGGKKPPSGGRGRSRGDAMAEKVKHKGFEIEAKPTPVPGGWQAGASIWLHYGPGIIHIPVDSNEVHSDRDQAAKASFPLGKAWVDAEVGEVEYRNHVILHFPSRVPGKWKASVLIFDKKSFLHQIEPSDQPDEFEQKEEAIQHYVSLGKDWIDQQEGPP